MAVGRFQVMAMLQAARAFELGLPLESAHSWGLNRAIFYAAAKRGFKRGGTGSGLGGGGRPGARETKADEFHLGDDLAFKEPGSCDKSPVFSFGCEAQTEERFQKQVQSRFSGSFKDAWEDALDYVRHFPRQTLESQSGFYSDVYRPKRDEFAAKWTETSGSTPTKMVRRKEKASGR
jgi:hypothetical protein